MKMREEYAHEVVKKLVNETCQELRKLFKSRWKEETGKDWQASADQVERLREKLYDRDVYIFPKEEENLKTGCTDKWDMTLLHKVLTKVRYKKNFKWENNEITKLKEKRDYFSHTTNKTLDKHMYAKNIKEIASSLKALDVENNVITKMIKKAQGENNVFCLKREEIKDSTTWDDLSDELQEKMGTTQIKYKGKTVTLNHFIEKDDTLINFLDGSDLIKLAKNDTPVLLRNRIPDQLQYYIQRTIESKKKLKPEVFKHDCNDVFVVQGVEMKQLSSLAGKDLTDEELTKRFIKLEDERHFELIRVQASETPVHWIKYQVGQSSYEWVKSSGSVKNLQNYVHTSQVQFGEEELGQMKNKINVISDSPGMGKSILLVNIAHTILKGDDTKFISFIEFNEMIQSLENQEINLDNIVSVLAEQFSKFKFGRKLMENVIKTSPCVLMFDGFDEVLSHQISIAKNILKKVAKLEYAQLFVTTRPHMREELENSLQVLGYTIMPFDDANQLSFLLGYWKTMGVETNESVQQFAKSCLNSLNRELSDFENQIAGIPLQCKMLSEAYIEHAKRCTDETQQSIKLITSVFEMYERHMSMRFDRISKHGSCLKCFKRVHTYLALKLLFPEQEEEFNLLNDESIPRSQICGVGLVEGTHSTGVRFVHRTFAEYLVAWHYVEKCGRGTKLIFQEIFSTSPKEELLKTPDGDFNSIESFQFKFPLVCYFINEFMKRLPQQNLKGLINNLTSSSLLHKQVWPLFFACSYHNYVYVLLSLSKLLGAINQQQEESHKFDIGDILLIAAKYGDVELLALMRRLCENFDITKMKFKTSQQRPFCTISPLHIAIQRGHCKLVWYLMNQYKDELIKLPYLIHFCVYHSLGHNKATLNSKIQIIKLLCTKSKQWLDEPLPLQITPLLQEDVNMKLLECLIEQGADVNVVEHRNGYTVLHKVLVKVRSRSPITPEAFHKLVQAVDKRGFNLYYNMSLNALTPLQCAVLNMEVLESTLQFLHSKGVDFDRGSWIPFYTRKPHPVCKSKHVIFHAIRGGRTVQFLQALIKFGADWKCVNMQGQCVLHNCVESRNLEALKYFLEFHQIDVNLEDRDLTTPLHQAVLKSSESHEIMQQLLISKGANVNARTIHNKNPFEIAFEQANGLTLTIIHLMEKHGLVITGQIADKVLKAAFRNTHLLLDSNCILEALHYLYGIQKTAVFRSHFSWNPWKFEKVQKNLPKIIKDTKVTSLLLQKANEFQLLKESELKDIEETEESLKSGRFYELVQRNEESFKNLFMSLLYGKQLGVLSQLIYSLATAEGNGKVFVTAPPGVTQFKGSEQSNMSVLVSSNLGLTISRIQETFHSRIDVIGNHSLPFQRPINKLTVFKSRTVTNENMSKLEQLIITGGKIICVCREVINENPNRNISTDSFDWEDVSRKFFSLLQCTFSFSLVNFTDLFATPKIMQEFPKDLFYYFNSGDVCIMTDFKVGHQLNQVDDIHLSTEVFDHYLPDKLVFKGIAQGELKEKAKYGQRIGCIGEDIDKLDYIVAENLNEIEEFLKATETNNQNVHLIEYKENTFCLVRTWGETYHIEEFVEKPLICDNFPACECESGIDQVIFNCSFCLEETPWENITFEYSTTLNELLPNMLELLKIQDSIELTEVTKLLEKVSGKRIPEEVLQANEEETSKKKGIFEEIEQRITKLLDLLNITDDQYRDLRTVAESTIFPGRITNQGIKTLGRFVTEGLLAKKQESLIVVNQSLACYLVSNTLVKNELTQNLAPNLFRDCIELHHVRKPIPYFSSGLDSDFSTETFIKFQCLSIKSYKFAHGQLLKFVESHAFKNGDMIQDLLKKHISSNNLIVRWVQASVHANHYNLLQILVALESYALSSKSEENAIILAVLYAGVPIIDLLINKFIQKTSKQVELITLNISAKEMEKEENVDQDAPPPKRYRSDKEMEEDEEKKDASQPSCDKEFQTISLLHLAALRGDYTVMDYLIKNHFKDNLSQRQLRDALFYTVIDTKFQVPSQIEERKRIIVELLLQLSPSFISEIEANSCHPLFAPYIHIDLLLLLICKGLEDDFSLRTVLHFCPTYMTPQQYDTLIQDLFDRGKAEIFHSNGNTEKTPLHRAVQHFEPLESTIQVFSSSKFDFNNGIIFTAVEHKERSVRLLESLIRAGADFQKRDKDGLSVLHYAAVSENLTAMRYFISRGCDVNASNSDNNTPLHLVLYVDFVEKIHHELVQVLIQNGADVNAIGKSNTPLSIAVYRNRINGVENRTLELMKNAGVNLK